MAPLISYDFDVSLDLTPRLSHSPEVRPSKIHPSQQSTLTAVTPLQAHHLVSQYGLSHSSRDILSDQ